MFAGRPGAKSPSSNGPSGKTAVSDAQAREKLAVSTVEGQHKLCLIISFIALN